jgi:hypothetical protein
VIAKQKNDLHVLVSDVLCENMSEISVGVFGTRETAIDEAICVRERVKRQEKFVYRMCKCGIAEKVKITYNTTKNRWKV